MPVIWGSQLNFKGYIEELVVSKLLAQHVLESSAAVKLVKLNTDE